MIDERDKKRLKCNDRNLKSNSRSSMFVGWAELSKEINNEAMR